MTDSPGFQPRSAWAFTVLLTGLATINYLDKIVFGMVAVPLMAEMHLSQAEFGLIAGSIFWLFSISTILIGFLSNRVPTRWLLLIMSVTWALLQVPQALATSAAALLVSRVILGAAEGPAYSVSIHALYKWFPNHKCNLPLAIVNQGAAFGLLLAGLLIPLVTREWGWRMNFLILGAMGALWSVLWLYFGREGNLDVRPTGATVRSDGDPGGASPPVHRLPYRKILTDPSILSIFLLGFAAYWTLGQSLTWLPIYLEKGLGFTSIEAGRWFAVVVGVIALINVGLSWVSQRMLERGASTRQARAQLTCLAMIAGGVILVALPTLHFSPVQRVMLYALAVALPNVCFALAPALVSEVVPQSQRGAIVAIYTALASSGGAIAPTIMGRIAQALGSTGHHAYELGFTVGAALLIVAALVGLRWLHPERSSRTLHRSTTPAMI